MPPLLLLIYPLHNKTLSFLKIRENRCVQRFFFPLDKLKPMFDSFQGCYKDQYRFFSGLYFFYRFFIMLNVIVNYLHISFLLLEIQLVGMLIFHAICQPYKKRLHNVIDILLFGNLAGINAIIYCNLSLSLSTVGYSVALSVIGCVLILLPLPIMATCLLAHTSCARKCWNKAHPRSTSSTTESYFLSVRRNRDSRYGTLRF